MNTMLVHRRYAASLALAVIASGCSGAHPGQGSFLPAPSSAKPVAMQAALPQAAGKGTRLALVLQNVAPKMRSVYVVAESEKNSNELFTTVNITPTSAGCTSSGGKTTCTVDAAANAGVNAVTVKGYGMANATGKVVFETQFIANAPSGVTTSVTVPNALYLNYFPVKGSPYGSLTKGPKGDPSLWFVDWNGDGRYADQISTTGTLTPHLMPTTDGNPNEYTSIEAGPNSKLWFVLGSAGAPSYVDSITTAGAITSYPATFNSSCNAYNVPVSIANGPDGNAWFTEFTACGGGGAVGKITPSGAITDYPLPVDGNKQQIYTLYTTHHQIVAGKDGALWIYANGCVLSGGFCTTASIPTIIRVTTGGGMRFFKLEATDACSGGEVALGGDGNVWFMRPCTPPGKPGYELNTIGRITSTGSVKYYYAGLGTFNDIASGPDKNLYFTEQNGVERFVISGAQAGQLDAYPQTSSTGSGTNSVATGPDGHLYLTAAPYPYTPHGWVEKIEVP